MKKKKKYALKNTQMSILNPIIKGFFTLISYTNACAAPSHQLIRYIFFDLKFNSMVGIYTIILN